MNLSVIIPTCGNLDALLRVLNSLAFQQGLDYEVLVVQDMSDRAAQIERDVVRNAYAQGVFHLPAQLHWHRTLRDGSNGAAAARNVGLRHASAPRVLFVDDDCVCPPGLLAVHAPVGYGDALVGFRRRVDGWQNTRQDAWELPASPDVRWSRVGKIESDFRHNSPFLNAYVFTCHLSVPLVEARAIGGFWEEMKGSGYEDREFALRLQRLGCGFTALRAPMVSHLDHQQRPSQRDNVPVNRCLFSRTVDDHSLIVRNGGPIRDANRMAESD
jgi:glycosyltransferase involved in cell wall biosynthesis